MVNMSHFHSIYIVTVAIIDLNNKNNNLALHRLAFPWVLRLLIFFFHLNKSIGSINFQQHCRSDIFMVIVKVINHIFFSIYSMILKHTNIFRLIFNNIIKMIIIIIMKMKKIKLLKKISIRWFIYFYTI